LLLLLLLVAALLLVLLSSEKLPALLTGLFSSSSSCPPSSSVSSGGGEVQWETNSISASSSGNKWKAKPFRQFVGPRLDFKLLVEEKRFAPVGKVSFF